MPDFTSDGQPFEMPESAANKVYAATPPGFGAEMGALVESGPGASIARAADRGQYAGSSWIDQMLGYLNRPDQGPFGFQTPDEIGAPLPGSVASPVMSPEDYNAKYAPIGPDGKPVSLGSQPMPEGVAQLVGQAKQDEITRQGVLSRFADAHPVANFATGMAGFMLDPLNASSTFLPGIGEESILARLGSEGLAARVGARVIAGGASGAIAQAPLSAIQYGLGTEEASDYDLRSALKDVAFGAAGGAILHALGGTVRDLLGRSDAAPILGADVSTKADAMKAAIAQMVDGREIDVDPVFQERALSFPETVAAQNRIAAMRAQITGLSREADQLKGEAGAVGAPDEATQARLDAIDDELTQPGATIDPARAQALDAERTMLTQGPAPKSDLEQARDEAQRAGLLTAAQNKAATIDDLYRQIAERQRDIYENGYAPGIPQPEFAAMRDEIYAPKPAEEGGAPEAPEAEQASEGDKAMSDAEGAHQAMLENGVALHPEDKAELDRTQRGLDQANDHEAAYNEAANCLGEAV